AFNLSRLRIFAVPGANARAAVKKLHEFCDVFFVEHSSNLLVAGGISALNLAALHGNLQGVVQLVQSGAAINARHNAKNHTALHEAIIGGHKEVATYLLSMGANQLLRDDQGYTPLHHACRLVIISLARVLIQDASGKRALLTSDNNDQKPIELCASPFMRQRVETAMRKLKIFVKPRVSILDR
ncbi:ankyrin repeat-containing domain protein, partial [Ochromonadaceae sp. CCMP2298]